MDITLGHVKKVKSKLSSAHPMMDLLLYSHNMFLDQPAPVCFSSTEPKVRQFIFDPHGLPKREIHTNSNLTRYQDVNNFKKVTSES